jgi:Rod binding domain-containing protein
VTDLPLMPLPSAGMAPSSSDVLSRGATPAKIEEAAQEFEAMLLSQILHSAREGGGWLGSGEDPSGDCATDFAEQRFAAVLAQQGGLGLANLISAGLKRS